MKYRVFLLTVDSESSLWSEVHPTRQAAYQALVNASEWVIEEAGVDPSDEDEFRDALGEENVYYDIEETVLDMAGFDKL